MRKNVFPASGVPKSVLMKYLHKTMTISYVLIPTGAWNAGHVP
jgi:hypothetical protein